MSQEPAVQVRPFTSGDYEGLCQVINTATPEYPETPDEVRHQDATRNALIRHARWIAEADGQAVGYAQFAQTHVAEARKFGVELLVVPEWRGQGVGSLLYRAVQDALLPLDPVLFRVHVRESEPQALEFARARGFVEVQRERESRLDLADWDADKWGAAITPVADAGFRIATYAQLKSEAADLADLHHRLHELMWTVGQDIPTVEPYIPIPHDDWLKRFDKPDFLPDGQVFALDGERLVGVSVVWASAASAELWTGTTGVLREYRGRGLATALKVTALSYAKVRGASAVRTFNEVNNKAMLGINQRLGFAPLPVWLELHKTFALVSKES